MHVGSPTGGRARIRGHLCRSSMTLNWRKSGPARPKTALCPSGFAPRAFLFQPGWLFGLSVSRISPRLLRAGGRLPHRRCAVMFTSQKPCQGSGCYCVVPLNLLAPPWMLWRAFWPPSASAAFAGLLDGACRGPCWSLAHVMGCAAPTLALGPICMRLL